MSSVDCWINNSYASVLLIGSFCVCVPTKHRKLITSKHQEVKLANKVFINDRKKVRKDAQIRCREVTAKLVGCIHLV